MLEVSSIMFKSHHGLGLSHVKPSLLLTQLSQREWLFSYLSRSSNESCLFLVMSMRLPVYMSHQSLVLMLRWLPSLLFETLVTHTLCQYTCCFIRGHSGSHGVMQCDFHRRMFQLPAHVFEVVRPLSLLMTHISSQSFVSLSHLLPELYLALCPYFFAFAFSLLLLFLWSSNFLNLFSWLHSSDLFSFFNVPSLSLH